MPRKLGPLRLTSTTEIVSYDTSDTVVLALPFEIANFLYDSTDAKQIYRSIAEFIAEYGDQYAASVHEYQATHNIKPRIRRRKKQPPKE